MSQILDGRALADSIKKDLAARIRNLEPKPKLIIVQVGGLEETNAYIRQKKIFGEKIGALVEHQQYPADIIEIDLLKEIKRFNSDLSVHGIIIQLPLADHLDKDKLTAAIKPEKDVDGLGPANIHFLWNNNPHCFIPATTKGILALLVHYEIPVSGKKVVIVGRSALVGKPTALAFLNQGATVTICHRQTKNLAGETRRADIIIVAAGQPKFLDETYVKAGQVIIDVGINLLSGQKLEEEISGRQVVGDVDFEKVKDVVAAVSPVPGGVGPMTVASLFENLLEAYSRTILKKEPHLVRDAACCQQDRATRNVTPVPP